MSFLDKFLSTQHSLSVSTKRTYVAAFLQWSQHSEVPFDEGYLDSDLVHQVLTYIGEDVERSSWNSYVLRYKRVAKWLSDPDDLDMPRVWRGVKLFKIDWGEKLKGKRLSEDEVRRIISAGDHPRDKALVGVAWDAGLRVGELLGLRIEDCRRRFTKGFNLTVSGKTGTRTVPIAQMAPLLESWLNHHPCRNDLQAYVFIRRKGSSFKPLTVKGASLVLAVMVRRSGVGKPVSFHWFRHTKATWLSEKHMNEASMREVFGWSRGSNMPARYTHLHEGVAGDTKLALEGVETIEIKTELPLMAPLECFRCGFMNSFDASHCQHCGLPLNREEAEKMLASTVSAVDRETLDLFRNPDFQDFFFEVAKKYRNKPKKE